MTITHQTRSGPWRGDRPGRERQEMARRLIEDGQV